MRRAREKSRREPTIALINIVFLMLVFFMVAGTLAQPLDRDMKLIRTADLEGRAAPDALVIHEDATLSYRGTQILSPAAFMARQEDRAAPAVRLIPDRDLPARDLIRITRELRSAGAERVLIVTERGLE
ncbi:biopolymer transporter ExbD [Pelagivirga sediminicola]|uniref:Biopolymer transporter ExbD n=1 Tax=Pelagivirga sediminicola TaxID=2170575 RepID=A0A2T7G836_9RHOB|nr:biopolymer transporter ExbD [Pelagivirga sediminicola]PVA10578.1 biopolymer transporter ExbD [Pelagivirga sediminicola]